MLAETLASGIRSNQCQFRQSVRFHQGRGGPGVDQFFGRAGAAKVIVDTSAVMAILFRELDAELFARAIATASSRRMSVAALVKTAIVLESRSGPAAGYELDAFLQEAGIQLEPVTADQAQAARRVWRRFGKGNHPAGAELRRLLLLCACGSYS